MGGDHLLGTVPSIWKDFVLGTLLSGNFCIFGTLGGEGLPESIVSVSPVGLHSILSSSGQVRGISFQLLGRKPAGNVNKRTGHFPSHHSVTLCSVEWM